MKLYKKKVRILLAGLVILTIITSVLCSFAPPTIGWTPYNVYALTETDVENIMAVADFQYQYGSFNSFVPVACHLSNSTVRLYLVPSNANWTFTETSGTYTLTTGSSNIMRTTLTREGFGMQYTGSTATIPEEHLLFYRSESGTLVKGEAFSYATGADNDVIADCAAAWFDTWNIVNGYETAIEEAESVGFESGYDVGYAGGLEEGESIGYQDGYVDGFDTGMDYGYQFGYQDGVATGRSEGYSQGYLAGEAVGYESGYADGYDDGYAAAEPGAGEVVTEIVYRDAVDLDIPLIFDSMADATNGIFKSVDFNIFGINILGVLLSITILVILVFIFKKFKS